MAPTSCLDVVIIGAGAAGLFCAGVAGQRGLKVLVIDHAPKVAEKIRISGGGRCNFTNRDVSAANFLGENPAFSRSVLAGYTPLDFISLLEQHRITWHEKHRGQLFCDHRADDIVQMLLRECDAGQVQRWQPCCVRAIRRRDQATVRFELDTDQGIVLTHQLVIATGGPAIPKIGATDAGQRWAVAFGHRIVPLRPALVPLTFDVTAWTPYVALAGLSLEVRISTPSCWPQAGKAAGKSNKAKGPQQLAHFTEDLLFTHRGLSGPAVLQISSHWQPGQPLTINLNPQQDLATSLKDAKSGSRKQLSTAWGLALGESVPQRLAQAWLNEAAQQRPALQAHAALAELKDKDLDALGHMANAWQLTPSGTEGYAKAEVTAGGVDTRELQQRSMESKLVPGLHFVGEVVDITGWLGGYNFQWAWASAMACARALQPAQSAATSLTV
jgi:predicted Rossmann fold flavoprotein